MRFRRHLIAYTGVAAALFATIPGLPTAAQSTGEDAHLAIADPAALSKEDAQRIYDDLKLVLDDGYAHAQMDIIRNYQTWPIYNDAPYISSTHGQRYVNSYANSIARNYGTLAPGETLPEGSVLAKDSITVMEDGRAFPAALFIMEKLAKGTNPDTADWRYVMVIPDGSLYGDTMGDQAERVAYCHTCHADVADRDYTFYVPQEYRLEK